MCKALEAFVVLALVAALPAVAAPSETDTVASKAEAGKKAEPGPDCAEPLRDDKGKPTDKYDPRCTEEMIKAAVAKKKADAASAGAKAGYDLAKIAGLEGLGKSAESEAAGEKEYGTLEDIFGLVGRFDASKAYAEPAASDDADDADRG
jgi:hypothetical protein